MARRIIQPKMAGVPKSMPVRAVAPRKSAPINAPVSGMPARLSPPINAGVKPR